MIVLFYDAPGFSGTSPQTLMELHLFNTMRVVSYTYTKRWTEVGDFTLCLPFDKDVLRQIRIGGVIAVDESFVSADADWLWIQGVSYDGSSITITGKDLKGWLACRVALPRENTVPGAAGYDPQSGPTKSIIKHYLDFNLIDPEDSNRKMPLTWDENGADGLISGDSYLARFEPLSEIIGTLCDGAGIGYDIRGTLSANPFLISTIAGADRRRGQSVNSRAIFSLSYRNICSQSFEHGVSELLNTIYATGSDDVTLQTNRDSTAASGIARRECHIDVSVSSLDNWFDKYTLDQVRDSVETHSYTIDVSTVYGYGVDYSLGDLVTVHDSYTNDYYDARITEVTKTIADGQRKIAIVLGQPRQKPFQRVINQLLSGTAKKSHSGTGTLTSSSS